MNVFRKVTKKERRFLGVCGGISRYIDPELDPTMIRLVWLMLTLFNPIMILIYFGLAIVLNTHEKEFDVNKWKNNDENNQQNFMNVKENNEEK